jgi:hypothetical protein
MAIGKIFVLGLVFFLIFKFLSINIFALFIGISVVQLVVFSMITSIVLVNMLNNVRGVDLHNAAEPPARTAKAGSQV